MEDFQNNLSFVSYSQDFGKTSQTDGYMMLSNRNSSLSESQVLTSEKSPVISFHSMYQPSGIQADSVHQQDCIKYSDREFGASTNAGRAVGLDMTNKNASVNMDLNSQTSGFESKIRSLDVSNPLTSNTQVTSSYSNSGMSGNIQIQNYGNSVVNMSTANISNDTKDNSLSFGLHTFNRSYVPCEEKPSIDYMYRCGGCEQSFYTICKLHAHIKTHNGNGSYYFSESTKTAYPKFVTDSRGTQTGHGTRHTKYSKVKEIDFEENSNAIVKSNSKDTSSLRVDTENMARNVVNLASEGEPEIKIEKEDPDCVPDINRINKSGSDTDDYKPEESLILNGKKKQKVSKRKHRNKSKVHVTTKGSKKLKKLKMTIRLKQEVRKEKRVSFLKKDRKTKASSNMTVKRKKTDEKITCNLCKEDFTKRLFLRHHIKSKHSDVEYLCQLCGEQFTVDEDLIEHRKTVHNRGFHQCELCDKVLSTKGMLEGHYLVHKGIKPFACEICVPKKEFTRKCQLKAHMETHSTEKTLQCEFCGKPFNARYLMLSHVKHCGGIKPHKCEYCEMSFVSNHCLQRHRRTHTGEKPFVCEVCAFASSNASCLSRHMRTHTGEKPFKCQFCEQTFAARGALKKHVRIHTQEKPYKCRFCTKAFTQNWNLKTHERQHTGETPYKCHVCGIGYKQNVLLKTHLRTHFGQNSESSESQNLALNQSVSQSQSLAENQSNINCQSHSSMQTCSKSENLKSEFPESQSINSQSQLIELHSQPLVPNMLLSTFLHSGYNMN